MLLIYVNSDLKRLAKIIVIYKFIFRGDGQQNPKKINVLCKYLYF